jgi:hypothetical protein
MFRVQGRRVGKDRKTREREKQIIGGMGGAKLANRCRDRVQIALDQVFVQTGDVARSYFCFLAAAFVFATFFLGPATTVPVFAVVDLSVSVPPSATERLSSMSMVCVSASSLFAAGVGCSDGFGSLIVVAVVVCASLLRDLHPPVSIAATQTITSIVRLTGTSAGRLQCKFPDRAFR